jgi:hypothetical protein
MPCLHLQVKPTQFDPIAGASPYLRTGLDGDRIQYPKRCVMKYKQDGVLDKNRTMYNAQKPNICTNVITIIIIIIILIIIIIMIIIRIMTVINF